MVGDNAKLVGRPISIMASEGRFEFGVNDMVRVASANIIAFAKSLGFVLATETTLTAMVTPSKAGVGNRFVYNLSMNLEEESTV